MLAAFHELEKMIDDFKRESLRCQCGSLNQPLTRAIFFAVKFRNPL